MQGIEGARWSVFRQTTRGPRHAQRGQDNQDAAASYQPQPPTLPIALAVADGHGSARYIRSGQGSKFAAELAIEHLAELEKSSRAATLSDIKRAATEQLPRKLHLSWRTHVLEHLAENPLNENDHAHLRASGARERDLQTRPEFMYGSTLLAALITNSYAVFIQIGDGDLMVAWPASSHAGNVFEADESHLGDQTHSLSSPHAWRHVHVLFQPLIKEYPLLVLASTDGYGKAFRTQADFDQVAADLRHLAENHGTRIVAANLASWLTEAAEISGDDATAAIAIQVFEPTEATVPSGTAEASDINTPAEIGLVAVSGDSPDAGIPNDDVFGQAQPAAPSSRPDDHSHESANGTTEQVKVRNADGGPEELEYES